MTAGAYAPPTIEPVPVVIDGETLTTKELVNRLANGNPGAVVALVRGLHQAIWSGREGGAFLLEVWSSRLRGPELHVAFVDECGCDAEAFVKLIGSVAAAGGAR